MRSRRFNLLLPSIVLGGIVGSLVPTPNATGGGAAKMFLIIFLAVAFKAAGDYTFNRPSKRKNDHSDEDPGD